MGVGAVFPCVRGRPAEFWKPVQSRVDTRNSPLLTPSVEMSFHSPDGAYGSADMSGVLYLRGCLGLAFSCQEDRILE